MLKRSVLATAMVAGFVLTHPSAPANALEDCQSNCAVITVGMADVPVSGSAGSVTVNFQQAPATGPAGEGPDDIAAIAFSVGIPGSGAGNPLVFACDGGQLATGAVAASSAIEAN